MTIHREGYATILFSIVLLGILNAILFYFFPGMTVVRSVVLVLSTVLFLLILYFFRSPAHKITEFPGDVLSPADGKVVAIEEVVENEYFRDKRMQISVFMSPLNVHLNRYPVTGTVKYFRHHNGHFHVAWHPKSSEENERTTTVVRSNGGRDILFRQIAGAVARRIVSYAKVDSEVVQGEECGFIKFGSRVDIILPLDAGIKIRLGMKVKGGSSVLASLSDAGR